MEKFLLDSYDYLQSYLSLNSKNVVKFYVYISPIFSCWVTNGDGVVSEDIQVMEPT